MPLNPALAETFPFLSQIADAYEEYRLRGLVFEFKSTSSEYVVGAGGTSSGALGTVIMATNYNAANNPAFTDKKSMENYQYAQSAAPTKSMLHQVECKGSGTPLKTLYLRTGPAAPNTDIRMYDLGNFCIATQGMITEVDNATIGELWVAYDVEFFKPKYRTLGSKTDHFSLRFNQATPASNNLVGGCEAGASGRWFGTAPLIDRLHPTIGPVNPNNGVFGGTTYITNVGGSGSYIWLPENPGAVYKITMIIQTSDALGRLRADTEGPRYSTTLQSCERVTNWYNNWSSLDCEAPFANAGSYGAENSRCWILIQLVRILPFDRTNPPYFQIAGENAPDVAEPYGLDLFVEQVNAEYYIDPASV